MLPVLSFMHKAEGNSKQQIRSRNMKLQMCTVNTRDNTTSLPEYPLMQHCRCSVSNWVTVSRKKLSPKSPKNKGQNVVKSAGFQSLLQEITLPWNYCFLDMCNKKLQKHRKMPPNSNILILWQKSSLSWQQQRIMEVMQQTANTR